MKLSLRNRFLLLILPLIGINLFLLTAVAVRQFQITDKLGNVKADLAGLTQGAQFGRLASHQVKETIGYVLSGDDADRQRLLNTQAAAQDALRRWQELQQRDAGRIVPEVQLLDQIGQSYARIVRAGQMILEQMSAGSGQAAGDLVRRELIPAADDFDREMGRMMEIGRIGFAQSSAEMRGRMVMADMVSGGIFAAQLDGTVADAFRAILAQRLAGDLGRQVALYTLSVLEGQADVRLPAAQQTARETLELWNSLLGTQSAERAAVQAIQQNYARLGQMGLGLLSLLERGQRDQAVEMMGRQIDPTADGEITPPLEQIAAANLAQVERDMAVISLRVNWLVGLVGLVSLLGLGLGLGSIWLTTRQVIVPVVALRDVAARLGTGELDARARKMADDELGELATAFNGMAASLGQALQQAQRTEADLRLAKEGLETRVAERTAELQQANERLQVELGERQRGEVKLQQANTELARSVQILEQRTREIGALTEMGDMLQACATLEEAYQVAARSARQLFPSDSGAVFSFAPSRDILELSSAWGEMTLAPAFAPEECWALRRGHVHLMAAESGPRCQHVGKAEAILCVPMVAQGEMLGVLSLQFAPTAAVEGEALEAKRRLGLSVADHLGLALANLRLRESLRNLSIRDPLTGLYNRRYLDESLDRELHRAERRGLPLGVMMLDIDLFKRFNDTYGHEAGDAVLKELAAALGKSSRAEDIACRYGGEELALILTEGTLEVTLERAEQLREAVSHMQVQHGGQTLGTVTISVGVAAYPAHGATAVELLQAADAALYCAKRAGRDRVEVAGASPTPAG